ncbi:MAG: PilW family protein [Gammaproteobacteria bacterium]|nr:PilW family protein [Gammaproteobacteria bacterium]
MTNQRRDKGFTLVELMVAMVLAAVIITASTRIAAAIHSAWRHQQNLSALQHNARFAFGNLGEQVAAAGFGLTPWSGMPAAIAPGTVNALTANSDRLVVTRRSPENCFGNANPVRDTTGQPEYFLLESSFWINSARNLAMRCRYGVDANSLVTQLSSFGLVEEAHAMQVLFAEDTTGDLNADRWVRAGGWTDEKTILAVKIGLLLGTPETVHATTASPYRVLDESIRKADSGKAYRVFEATLPIRGRVR